MTKEGNDPSSLLDLSHSVSDEIMAEMQVEAHYNCRTLVGQAGSYL